MQAYYSAICINYVCIITIPVSVQAYTCINLNIAYNWAKKQTNSRKVDSVWLLDINQNLNLWVR